MRVTYNLKIHLCICLLSIMLEKMSNKRSNKKYWLMLTFKTFHHDFFLYSFAFHRSVHSGLEILMENSRTNSVYVFVNLNSVMKSLTFLLHSIQDLNCPFARLIQSLFISCSMAVEKEANTFHIAFIRVYCYNVPL